MLTDTPVKYPVYIALMLSTSSSLFFAEDLYSALSLSHTFCTNKSLITLKWSYTPTVNCNQKNITNKYLRLTVRNQIGCNIYHEQVEIETLPINCQEHKKKLTFTSG